MRPPLLFFDPLGFFFLTPVLKILLEETGGFRFHFQFVGFPSLTVTGLAFLGTALLDDVDLYD